MQELINSLSELAKYGAVGIVIAALVVVFFVVKETFKALAEHRREMRALAESVANTMKEVVERNTDAHIKNAEAVISLKENLQYTCKFQR